MMLLTRGKKKKKDQSAPAEATDHILWISASRKKIYIRLARCVSVLLDAAPACESFYLPLWLRSAGMFPDSSSV